MNPFEARTLEAFLRAVSQLDQPLSPDLQQEIRRVSQALKNHETNAYRDIPVLVTRDDRLKSSYDAAYKQLAKQYQSQERTKSLAIAAANGSASLDLESQIAYLLNAEDMIASAQRFVQRLDAQTLSQAKPAGFWERGDRVIALGSGGAFLGALLAQIPGAIVGGLVAGIYAWFSAPQAKTDRNT